MRNHGVKSSDIWNNKYPNQITVKCFTGNNLKQVSRLNKELYNNGYETQITMRRSYDQTPEPSQIEFGLIARLNPNQITE